MRLLRRRAGSPSLHGLGRSAVAASAAIAAASVAAAASAAVVDRAGRSVGGCRRRRCSLGHSLRPSDNAGSTLTDQTQKFFPPSPPSPLPPPLPLPLSQLPTSPTPQHRPHLPAPTPNYLTPLPAQRFHHCKTALQIVGFAGRVRREAVCGVLCFGLFFSTVAARRSV